MRVNGRFVHPVSREGPQMHEPREAAGFAGLE